jgi:hypothetical protein
VSKLHIPAFADLIPQLDMEAVAEAIFKPKREGQPPPKYSLDEFENIKEMIWAAGEKWLGRDLVDLNVESVEEKVLYPIGGTEIKGYLDLVGTLKGGIKPFDEFAGSRMVVDWKTRDGELDTRWRSRLIDSWQWKLYSAMSGAKVFNYRGVSRRTVPEAQTREIILAVPHTVVEEVENYALQLIEQRRLLIDMGISPWPRNMPDACRDGTPYECPFKLDCDNYTMPKFIPVSKVMSYTEFHRLQECPEFSRRMQGEPEADETEASNVGSGFHSGVAELWSQARSIKL